jgi:hypothetical protein
MVANAAGNYIDNAIAVLDTVLALRGATDPLNKVRDQLVLMKERQDYLPDYGHYLIDAEFGEPFVTQLLEVIEWRRRALLRRK